MFSVKFFEPIVIVGLLPFSALLWMTLESAAGVLVVEAAAPALVRAAGVAVVVVAPHAASPKVRAEREQGENAAGSHASVPPTGGGGICGRA